MLGLSAAANKVLTQMPVRSVQNTHRVKSAGKIIGKAYRILYQTAKADLACRLRSAFFLRLQMYYKSSKIHELVEFNQRVYNEIFVPPES